MQDTLINTQGGSDLRENILSREENNKHLRFQAERR